MGIERDLTMRELQIDVLHAIRGRVRIKLSCAFADPALAYQTVAEKGNIVCWRYNPLLRSLVVEYAAAIHLAEVLLRVASALAGQEKIYYVRINDRRLQRDTRITKSALLSLVTVLANMGLQVFLPNTAGLANIVKWCALGTTTAAIVEHGYWELNERGTFDPEVMSVVYMIDAVNKGKAAYAPVISWILTFGRHILQRNEASVTLRFEKDSLAAPNGRVLFEIVDRQTINDFSFFKAYLNQYLETKK